LTSTAAPPPPPPSSPSSSSSHIKNFTIPDYLKVENIGITSIVLEQRNLIWRYRVSEDMKGDIKVLITGDWKADSWQLYDKAQRKGFAAHNIELMVKVFNHIYSVEAVDKIAEIRAWVKKAIEAEKNLSASAEDDDKKPKVIKHYVQKYHDPSGGLELYEAILLGKDVYFISINRDDEIEKEGGGKVPWQLLRGFSISDGMTNNNKVVEILPTENLGYISRPYRFESEKEIDFYMEKASKLTLDQLYDYVKKIVQKYVAGSEMHKTILAGDIIFTYFQDIFGQTHYLFFYGDNGTGKTINLHLLEQIAYRVMFDVDITPANIYTFYGTVEEGQGVICEDEADDLDYKQTEKMKIYKKGYTRGGKVTRTETGGEQGRNQEGFYVYGFKSFTGEERLDPDYAKGFNERTFYIKCQEGDPEYDLTEVLNPAGEEEYEELLAELEGMHKTLLMYRLIHHTDKHPNIDVAVKNREKQLIKPLVRLFQGTESLKEITKALGDLIAERRGVKKGTIEYALYRVIDQLVKDGKTHEFTAKLVYTSLREELDGEYKDENKDQSFETPMHGKVSHKKISIICEDRFGAKIKHTNNGNMLIFDQERFNKVKAAYSLDDEGVQIIKEGGQGGEEVKDMKDVKDSSSIGQDVKEKEADIDDENRTESEEEMDEENESEEEENV
jgi:hypothetical protein